MSKDKAEFTSLHKKSNVVKILMKQTFSCTLLFVQPESCACYASTLPHLELSLRFLFCFVLCFGGTGV
jgi:hypothetical protein